MVKKRLYNPALSYESEMQFTTDLEQEDSADIIIKQLLNLLGLLLLFLSVGLVLALSTWHMTDPSLSYANGGSVHNLLGKFGAIYADLSMQFLGLASPALILPLLFWSLLLLAKQNITRFIIRLVFAFIELGIFCCFLSLFPPVLHWSLAAGLGGMVGDSLAHFVDLYLAPYLGVYYKIIVQIILLPLFFISAGLAGGLLWTSKKQKVVSAGKELEEQDDQLFEAQLEGQEEQKFINQTVPHDIILDENEMLEYCGGNFPLQKVKKAGLLSKLLQKAKSRYVNKERDKGRYSDISRSLLFLDNDGPHDYISGSQMHGITSITGNDEDEEPRAGGLLKSKSKSKKPVLKNLLADVAECQDSSKQYALPSLSFLNSVKQEKQAAQFSQEVLARNAKKLEAVLEEFGVKGKIINIRPGPVVTLYELEPAPGIKSSRIIGLCDDIARSMSALSVRAAVVPGRNAIGIELPNKSREMVYLRNILESNAYKDATCSLALALGADIGGQPVITDLAKMPHLLVAGTTGSGKSVGINTMILSLLYRLTPEQCRFIMVDPKMLELSVYEGIPHLLSPVVTDPKKAVVALKWAVREMEDRYRKMAKLGVRNIDGFNKRVKEIEKTGEKFTHFVQTGFDKENGKPIFEEEELELKHLPYIVIIIDEMADLMMVAGKEIEGAVQRLAQMARAAGLHVIMATQRPSVDVITGTIKANFPTRISFSVTSKIDSRTILGEQGAEQLLGQGDMLFMMGGGRIQRVHGPFVSDSEVEEVVRHWKSQGSPDYKEDVMVEQEDDVGSGSVSDKAGNLAKSEDLYDQAVALVLRDKKVSTSYVQRRLGIGYNKAANLIERMEEEGLISAANHVGKREILVAQD